MNLPPGYTIGAPPPGQHLFRFIGGPMSGTNTKAFADHLDLDLQALQGSIYRFTYVLIDMWMDKEHICLYLDSRLEPTMDDLLNSILPNEVDSE